MEKLGINAVQLLAQAVNFGIILFILKKFLYKPVLSMLDKRKQTIEENIKLQADLGEKLTRLSEKEKDLDKKDKLNAAKISGEARKDGEKSAAKIVEKAKIEAKEIIEQARLMAVSQIEREKKALDEKTEKRALLLANKILAELLPKEIKVKITEAQVKKLSQIGDKS